MYVALADAVLGLHLAYLAYLPLGGFIAMRWPRTIWLHVAAVLVGLASVTIHFDCPLTTWEQSLRRRGGQEAYRDGFVDHYLTGKLYPHGYAWAAQLVFAVCIAVSWTVFCTRWRAPRKA
jgi:Protein of Unknown function (DUF2784)